MSLDADTGAALVPADDLDRTRAAEGRVAAENTRCTCFLNTTTRTTAIFDVRPIRTICKLHTNTKFN